MQLKELTTPGNDADHDAQQQQLNGAPRKPQVFIVCPRRHMAIQARKMFLQIAEFYRLNCAALIGGMPSVTCLARLRSGLDVICGTPGKLMDMVEKGGITRDTLSGMVAFAMDGANELMSSESMKRQMRSIIDVFPEQRRFRVLWLEAVYSGPKRKMARDFIREHDREIETMADEKRNIDEHDQSHTVLLEEKCVHVEKNVHRGGKLEALDKILRYYRGDRIVVFFNTKHWLKRTYAQVQQYKQFGNRDANLFVAIHGEIANESRRFVLKAFESTPSAVLFTTDLLSVGYSMDVNVAVNYSVPRYECFFTYIKRCGISDADKLYMFTLLQREQERNAPSHGTPDEMIWNVVLDELRFTPVEFHGFSRDRRHHPSLREYSIDKKKKQRRALLVKEEEEEH